jgi:hypothetical protein
LNLQGEIGIEISIRTRMGFCGILVHMIIVSKELGSLKQKHKGKQARMRFAR